MLFVKVLLHLLSVIFSAVHKIFNVGRHLSLVDRAFLANNICLYILVYIFLWI